MITSVLEELDGSDAQGLRMRWMTVLDDQGGHLRFRVLRTDFAALPTVGEDRTVLEVALAITQLRLEARNA